MRRRSAIRVLVIDDSAVCRRAVTRMLEDSPLVEVVGSAGDGEEGLRKTLELEPDLVTLDLEMPRMDGFTYLRLLMDRRPTPVLVLSGRTGEQDVFRALELGAAEFVPKPTGGPAENLAEIERELIRKVHACRELSIPNVRERLAAPAPGLRPGPRPAEGAPRVVVIGSSTGGPAALMQILGAYSEPPPCAFAVAQHMPKGFTRGFAERIDRMTALCAREAEGGAELVPGSVLVAPGGSHLELESEGDRLLARVAEPGPDDRYVPSVDRLFESAAKQLGSDVLAVVLTGMGDDGRRGVQRVKQAGGRVFAESAATAIVFGMPQQAIRTGAVDRVLPLSEIADAIPSGAGGDS